MKTGKFLEGDIVRASGADWGVGTVYYHNITKSGYDEVYAVSFASLRESRGGHSCRGVFDDDSGMWMSDRDLELVHRPTYICKGTNVSVTIADSVLFGDDCYSRAYLETLV